MAKPITYTERERQLIEEARRKQGTAPAKPSVPIQDAEGNTIGLAGNVVSSKPLTPAMADAALSPAAQAGADVVGNPEGRFVGTARSLPPTVAGERTEQPVSPLVGALEKGTQDIYSRARAYLDENGGVRGLERTQNFWAAVRPGTSMDQDRVVAAPDGTKTAVKRNFFDDAETQIGAERLARETLGEKRAQRSAARTNLRNLNNRIRNGEAVDPEKLIQAQNLLSSASRPFLGNGKTVDSERSNFLRGARDHLASRSDPYEIPRPSSLSSLKITGPAPFATDSQEDQMDFLSRSLQAFR